MSSTTNNLSFEGIGGLWVGFYCPTETAEGAPVKISGEGTVAPCSAGDPIDGMVLAWSDNFATVQVKGFVTLSVSDDEDLTVGHTTLSGDGDGGIVYDEGGLSYLVVSCTGTEATILL